MRSRFVLTPEAREDLVAIWNYIAEDSPGRADKVLAKLYDAFVQLSRTPGIGHYREELADSAAPVLDYLFVCDCIPLGGSASGSVLSIANRAR